MKAPPVFHLGHVRSAARRMCGEKRGVAAFEFAIIGTLLLAATLGFFETVLVVRAKSQLSSAVDNMAEMVAAETGPTPVTQLMLQDFCQGAQLTMHPNATQNLAMAVASVTNPVNGGGLATDWEYDGACPTAATAIGSTGASALASSLVPNAGDSVIVIQASYAYVPVISTLLSSITLTQTAFSHPRAGTISCTTC